MSVGLLVGLFIGCGKESGPGGLQGLCEKLAADCGVSDVQKCVSDVSSCPNAEGTADNCGSSDSCTDLLTCYAGIAFNCQSTGDTDADTDEPTSATEVVDPSNTGDTTNTTEPVTSTTNPGTDPTTGPEPTTTPDPDTTNPDPDTTNPDPDTTNPDPDTTAPDPDTTEPSETTNGGDDDAYGPCAMTDPPCPTGSTCVSVTDVDGNFCSPDCSMNMACPDAPNGGAEAMCILTLEMADDPTNCALICDPMADDCPTGTTCKPIQGVGICTAP